MTEAEEEDRPWEYTFRLSKHDKDRVREIERHQAGEGLANYVLHCTSLTFHVFDPSTNKQIRLSITVAMKDGVYRAQIKDARGNVIKSADATVELFETLTPGIRLVSELLARGTRS